MVFDKYTFLKYTRYQNIKPQSSFQNTKSNHGDGDVSQHRGKESASSGSYAVQQENDTVNKSAQARDHRCTDVPRVLVYETNAFSTC